MHDIKMKSIYLIIPIIIKTSKPIENKHINTIILFLLISVFLSSLLSFINLLRIEYFQMNEFRKTSLFISHIRFSLMINFAVFSTSYLLLNNYFKNKYLKIIIIFICSWLIIFLFILKSGTGIVVLFSVSIFTIWLYCKVIKKVLFRYLLFSIFVLFFLIIPIYIFSIYNENFNIGEINNYELRKNTSDGNIYEHNSEFKLIENGNYVWINVCRKELEEEWNKRSLLSYNGFDYKGQILEATLVRYLASKNLSKDRIGMTKLDKKDILNIENGMANYIFQKKFSIYPIIYLNLWELDCYLKGYDYSNFSLLRRLVFFKTSIEVFKKNFLFGVGPGDLKNELQVQYNLDNSLLPRSLRQMPHNQFITFITSFGIIGFVIIVISFISPIIIENNWFPFINKIFLFIICLSFINEDTLESFIGLTFFVFFYTILILNKSNPNEENKKFILVKNKNIPF